MDRLEIARRYVGLGLSVIPVRPDGSKRPALDTWKEFQARKPTDDELQHWFGNGLNCGIAVVCGAVSRNLEILDFDDANAWKEFLAENRLALQSAGVPYVSTPSGGGHVYLFRKTAGPCRVVARQEDGKKRVEIKAEGGYVLAPGCPPECHPSGKTYEWLRPLTEAVKNG